MEYLIQAFPSSQRDFGVLESCTDCISQNFPNQEKKMEIVFIYLFFLT